MVYSKSMESTLKKILILIVSLVLAANAFAVVHTANGDVGEIPSDSSTNTYSARPSNPNRPERPEKKNTGSLYVHCNVSGASVYLNGSYKGTTPIRIKDLSPGYYTIKVTKEHYDEDSFSVRVKSDRTVSVHAHIEGIYGWLSYRVTPSNASIYCDGTLLHGNPAEVDEGYHTIKVRAFGYETESASVYVWRRRTQNIEVYLKPVVFQIGSISISRDKFNPHHNGVLGTVDIHFTVNAPETGQLSISDQTGQVMASWSYSFSTWDYTATWDGTDQQGMPVKDGIYTATLQAGGQTASCRVAVDSSLTQTQQTLSFDGTGFGPVTTARTAPEDSLIIQFHAGFQTSLEPLNIDAIPLGVHVSWAPTDYLEISGGLNANILTHLDSNPLTIDTSSRAVTQASMALKVGSSTQLSHGTTVYYGALLRVGGISKPIYSPYGVDVGNGLAFGIMLGYESDGVYIGPASVLVYHPIGNLFSSGNDFLWKNGLVLIKQWTAASLGLFGNVNSTFGTYEYTDSTSTSPDLEGSINAWTRALEFGGQASFFIGNSAHTFSLQLGDIYYPQDRSSYPYAKFILSFLL